MTVVGAWPARGMACIAFILLCTAMPISARTCDCDPKTAPPSKLVSCSSIAGHVMIQHHEYHGHVMNAPHNCKAYKKKVSAAEEDPLIAELDPLSLAAYDCKCCDCFGESKEDVYASCAEALRSTTTAAAAAKQAPPAGGGGAPRAQRNALRWVKMAGWQQARLVYCEADYMLCAHLTNSVADDGLDFLRKSRTPFNDYTLGVDADQGRAGGQLYDEPYGAMTRKERMRESVQRMVAANFCPDVPDAAFNAMHAAVSTWRGELVHRFKPVDGLSRNPFTRMGRHTYKGTLFDSGTLSINNLEAPQSDHALVSGADCQFWTEKRKQGSSICVGDGKHAQSTKRYQTIIGRLDNGAFAQNRFGPWMCGFSKMCHRSKNSLLIFVKTADEQKKSGTAGESNK